MLLRKNKRSLEEKVSLHDFFSSVRKTSKKRESLQNSAIKSYHEFHINSHKDLKMLVLLTPILILTRVILVVLWCRLHSTLHHTHKVGRVGAR